METQQQRVLAAGILSAVGIGTAIGACGGYNLHFQAMTEYCLPKTDCRAIASVDSRVFANFQEQAAKRAEELERRRREQAQARKRQRSKTSQGWSANLTRMGDDAEQNWESFAWGVGLNAEKAKNIFSSASTKRFLDNTAEARYRGWQLQVFRQHDGYAGVRRFLAAVTGISFLGALWLLHLLEDDQPRLDLEATIDDEFHAQAYRQQKQSIYSLWLEGLSWNMAESELLLKQAFTGLTRRQLAKLENQIENPALRVAPDQPPTHDQPALPGQSLEDITTPKNKVTAPHNRPMVSVTGQPGTTDPVKETWDFIKTWEGGWIVLLLESPVLLWGGQGSFKSYFAAYLALLRCFLKGHSLEIADPHLSLNKNEAWKALLQLGVPAVGEKRDYGAVARRIQEYFRRLDAADDDKAWHTAIFDEVTQYSLKKPTKPLAPELVLSCISDARKGKEGTILISHNNTQALLGGVEGAKKSLEEGLIQVHLFNTRDRDTGKFTPQFRGEITGLTDDSMDFSHITIDPQRMHPDYLLKLFTAGGSASRSPTADRSGEGRDSDAPCNNELQQGEEPSDLWQKAVRWLEQSWNLPSDSVTNSSTDSSELSDGQQGQHEVFGEETDNCEELSDAQDNVSGFVWTVRLVRDCFPDTTPEALFASVSASARTGKKVRDIVREDLKCREGREHPTRSYSRHGKTLFLWLVENFDDGSLTNLPQVKEFMDRE
jgi:hypothetical protein